MNPAKDAVCLNAAPVETNSSFKGVVVKIIAFDRLDDG